MGRQSVPGLILDEIVFIPNLASALVPEAGCVPGSMSDLIGAQDVAIDILRTIEKKLKSDWNLVAELRACGSLVPLASQRLAPVVDDGAIILSAAMNYYSHLAEMGNTPPPPLPASFLKARSAITGSGCPIYLPARHPDMVDWEGEFCAVIGRPGRDVPVENALDYVFGYTLMNDVSAREFVPPFLASKEKFEAIQTWERNVLGKNFPSFCPLGPVIVTKDELPDPADYHLTTTLNGEIMQSVHASDLVFSVAELVSYYSGFYGLQPGDIISTGSPAGVGMMKSPPRYLRPGDEISVHVDQIGTLTNTVRAID
jgi:2-keto-4-pentenoate hydratase/2-oxohepta-3-ene-1,7-dioic acid hydratase in catechol pathway